jgi:hypothetical protein
VTVSLLEILAAARVHAAPLAAESAGYLLLAVADHVVAAPRVVTADEVELTGDGSVRLRARRGAAPEDGVEAAVRRLLGRVLAVSSSVGPGLRRAAERSQDAGLDVLVRELETALIPVNRSAARRALSRVHRETERARDAGKLDALLATEWESAASVAAAPVAPVAAQVPVAPAAAALAAPAPPPPAVPTMAVTAPRVAAREPDLLALAVDFPEPSPISLPTVMAVATPFPQATKLAPRPQAPMPELTLTPEPLLAVSEAALTKPEPVVARSRERGSSTPRLGTVITAQSLPGDESDRTERAPAVVLEDEPEAEPAAIALLPMEATLTPDEATPLPVEMMLASPDEATPLPVEMMLASPDEATPLPVEMMLASLDEATPLPAEATSLVADEATPVPSLAADEATPLPSLAADEATPLPTEEATSPSLDEATPLRASAAIPLSTEAATAALAEDELEIDVAVELPLDAETSIAVEATRAAAPQPLSDPEPSMMPDVLLAMVTLHAGIDADDAPTRLRDVVTAVQATPPPPDSMAAPLVAEPALLPELPLAASTAAPEVAESTLLPEPRAEGHHDVAENVDDEWLTQSSLEDVVSAPVEIVPTYERVLFQSELADPELHEAMTWNPGPVVPLDAPLPPSLLIAEPPPELSPLAPAVLPVRSSEVSELLDSFYVSDGADESELRSALKEMAGLELTPAPRAASER